MKINEVIEEKMHHRGINQTKVCNECGLVVQNFNAFLKGNRNITKDGLAKVMEFLNLAFSKDGSVFPPSSLEERVLEYLKGSEEKMAAIAKVTNVSASTLSNILNEKRKMSTKVLNALVDYFEIQVATIK